MELSECKPIGQLATAFLRRELAKRLRAWRCDPYGHTLAEARAALEICFNAGLIGRWDRLAGRLSGERRL